MFAEASLTLQVVNATFTFLLTLAGIVVGYLQWKAKQGADKNNKQTGEIHQEVVASKNLPFGDTKLGRK